MAHYFIRYTSNPQADMERGYSFVGYHLVSSKEAALKVLAEYDGAAYENDFNTEVWNADNEHRVAQDNTTGLWGIVRSGLCGFGAFDSIDDAIENISNEGQQYNGTQYCVVFEGRQTYNQELDGLDDGQTFRPIAIVKTFILDEQLNNYVEAL